MTFAFSCLFACFFAIFFTFDLVIFSFSPSVPATAVPTIANASAQTATTIAGDGLPLSRCMYDTPCGLPGVPRVDDPEGPPAMD